MQLEQGRTLQVAAIPSLSHRYLTPLDLTRCVRVSREWHQAFIPHLWHTFSDSTVSQWISQIQYAVRKGADSTRASDSYLDDGRDVEWYLDVYRRHAMFIRRLTVCHPLILEALLEGGLRVPPSLLSSSSSLSSLGSAVVPEGEEKQGEVSLVTQLEHVEISILWNVIRRYFRYRPLPGVRGTHSLDDQCVSAYSDTEDDTNTTANNDNNESNNTDTDKDKDKDKDKTTTKTSTLCTTDDVLADALWRLVVANPGIKSLDLRQDFPLFRQFLQQTNPTPPALESIQSVTTQLVQGRLPLLPPNTRQVEATNVSFSQYNREDPRGPVNEAVEEVTVRYVEHLGQLRQILVQAPRLRTLYIEELVLADMPVKEEDCEDDSEEAVKKQKGAELEAEEERAVAAGGFVSGLQVVRCEYLHRSGASRLERLFRLTPHLVEFYNACWSAGYASILAENCPSLEVVSITSPRQQASLERNPKNPIVDTVSPLLVSCSRLRVVDMRYELVDAKKVREKEWVCLGLEELSCQFVGVPYLSEKEQLVLDRVLAREQKEQEKGSDHPVTRSEEEEELYDRTQQATSIRRQVLGQLSKLTRLNHLTLSPDLKIANFYNTDMYSLIYRSPKDGQHYINYRDILPDTLHLRLDCGLDQLATMTELEYLAFESMDPKMRVQDVEWIAERLTKLKEIRGLAADTHVGMEYDAEKDALRELLQRLRPDILHTESPGNR